MTLALLDLKPNDCRFPVGDLFCAGARRDGSSYCDHHHGLAYVTAGRRAFSSGAFLADYTETVAPSRPARAHEVARAAPAPVTPPLLDQFVRAAAARRHDAPERAAPTPATPAPAVHIKEPEPEPKTVECSAARLEQIKMLFVAVRTPQAVINQLPRIMAEVSTKHGISVADIKSPRRAAPIVLARQEYFYRARYETMKSYPEISRFCGGRDHTSGIWAVRQYEARLSGTRLTRSCHAKKEQV